MSVSKGSLLHRIFVKFFQEFVLVLVLLKVSCHDPGIDKMMCDNEDSWRQDSSAQTCPFDACHRKSPSFPSLGPCSTHWPCSTSEMRTWRGYLAYFLQFFPKKWMPGTQSKPFPEWQRVEADSLMGTANIWSSSAGSFCNKRQFCIVDRKYIWGFLFHSSSQGKNVVS